MTLTAALVALPMQLPAQEGAPLPGPESPKPVAFINVTVLPMDKERTLPGQTVLIRNGRIAAIGKTGAVRLDADVQRIDGAGKFLMPGITEMHGHLPAQPGPQAETILALYPLAGVTTVRGMQGSPAQLDMKQAVGRGEILGPTVYLAGPAIGGGAATPDEWATRVREQKAAGFDLLKIQEGVKPEVYDKVAATAKAVGIAFAGHVPNEVGLKRVLEAGQTTVDHLDNYVESLETNEFPGATVDEKRKLIVALTKRTGAGVVPTMALWEWLRGSTFPAGLQTRPELRYMPPETVKNWAASVERSRERAKQDPQVQASGVKLIDERKRMLRALRDAGVPILFGTDAPQVFSVPGFSAAREMERMADAGMTNYEILYSGTGAIAKHFKAQREFGAVRLGARADLVLLDANPLENIANFGKRAGVMLRGKWLPSEEIERRLAQIAGQYVASLDFPSL